jgi:hypothetical protein
VRERAWEPAVQLRCEAEKVIGGLVSAKWGAERHVYARVVARRSWVGSGKLKVLGWGFYRREREDGDLAQAAGESATRGSKSGGPTASMSPVKLAVAPASPAAEKFRRMEGS